MRNPNAGRSSIFAVVGGYLIYLAYELLKGLIDNTPTTMPRFLQIVVIVLFTGLGATLIVFAFIFWKRGREENPEDRVEIHDEQDSATNEKPDAEK